MQSTQSPTNPKNVNNNPGVQIQAQFILRAFHGTAQLLVTTSFSWGGKKNLRYDTFKSKENQMLVGDKEEHEGQKKHQASHGTKDAYDSDLMHMTERLNLIFTQAASHREV